MDAVWNLNTIVDRKRWGVGHSDELSHWRLQVHKGLTEAPRRPWLSVGIQKLFHFHPADHQTSEPEADPDFPPLLRAQGEKGEFRRSAPSVGPVVRPHRRIDRPGWSWNSEAKTRRRA